MKTYFQTIIANMFSIVSWVFPVCDPVMGDEGKLVSICIYFWKQFTDNEVNFKHTDLSSICFSLSLPEILICILICCFFSSVFYHNVKHLDNLIILNILCIVTSVSLCLSITHKHTHRPTWVCLRACIYGRCMCVHTCLCVCMCVCVCVWN